MIFFIIRNHTYFLLQTHYFKKLINICFIGKTYQVDLQTVAVLVESFVLFSNVLTVQHFYKAV